MRNRNRFFVFMLIMIVFFAGPVAWAEKSDISKELEFSETTVLEKQPDTFAYVRHIRLKGTQKQIGRKLAEIARERYGISLSENPSETYGIARYAYLQKNYPQLLERARGALEAYGLKQDDPRVDPTSLAYSMGDFGCSMIYFPAAYTGSGHCIAVRNMDFSNGSISQLLGKQRRPGEPDIFGEIYIVESYPDDGYAALYMGAAEILSGPWDGMNEHGLTIYGLVDNGRPKTLTPPSGSRVIGLHPTQVMRMVLETCRNCEEAKLALLTNKTYDFMAGIHYMVGDAEGNSFIFEINQQDGQAYIQEGKGKPHIMTNSPVWALPPLSEFPKTFDNPYDSMNRYRILTQFLESHTGAYSESSMIGATESVFPRSPLGDPNGPSMTFRPLWQIMYDMTGKEMKVRFWLKDAPSEGKGRPRLVMTDWYAFSLSKNRNTRN